MFTLVVSLRAKARIEEIADYIYEQWGQKAYHKRQQCLDFIS